MENFDRNIDFNSFSVEEKNNGDSYFISSKSKDKIREIIKKIAEGFGEPSFYQREIIETILDKGEEWRFQGAFSLKLLKNGILFFDNRNGRGVQENSDLMKKIINSLSL